MDDLVDRANGMSLSDKRENATSGETSAGDGGVEERGAEVGEETFRKTCQHYSRGCSFVSPCCGKVYPCRICHDDKEPAHKIDRHSVKDIVCRRCNTTQPVAEACDSCGLKFARYFCTVCRLYDDSDKGQFHCSKCGICRIGGHDNFFHCDTCGLCLAVSTRPTHLCRQSSSRDNCPVCMEDIHSSRDAAHVPKCGHLIHTSCFQDMLKNGLYQCPLCYASLVDMREQWRKTERERDAWVMPTHLRNFSVKIQCRDCRRESSTLFHVVGLKCSLCGSFNTVRCGSEEVPEDDGEPAGPAPAALDFFLRLLRREMEQARNGDEEEEEEGEEEGEEEEGEEGDEEDLSEFEYSNELLQHLTDEAGRLLAGHLGVGWRGDGGEGGEGGEGGGEDGGGGGAGAVEAGAVEAGGGEAEEEEEEEEIDNGENYDGDEEDDSYSDEDEDDESIASSGSGYELLGDNFNFPFHIPDWNVDWSDNEWDDSWPHNDWLAVSGPAHSPPSHHSDSSWETEEEVVTVGGTVEPVSDGEQVDPSGQASNQDLVPIPHDSPEWYDDANSSLGEDRFDTGMRQDLVGAADISEEEGWETAGEEVMVCEGGASVED